MGDIGLKRSILGRVTGPVMLDKSKEEMDMQDLKDLGTVDIFESLEDVVDPGIRRALGSLRQRMKKKNGQEAGKIEKHSAPPSKTAEVVQLPCWPESARGVPNSALRGALFAAIQGKDRRYMKRELLAVQQGVAIRFTGMQLDQSDLDVWEQALHLARLHPLGSRCEFTAHGFLKALGRSTGKPMHEWLKDVFARLAGCAVEITHNRMTYGGSLLEFYRDEDTQRYRLEINPKIKALYTAGWTACDWEQRKQLSRKPLALWLHGWLSSHAKPYPVKIDSLMQWSGSRTKQAKHFKANLAKALDDLKAVGALNSYVFSGGLVSINRTPSTSQCRYLTKDKPRKK